MKDGIPKNTGNSYLVKGTLPDDYAGFKAALTAGTQGIDLNFNSAGWQTIGTLLSKGNLLSDETAAKFGYATADDPTVDDVLGKIPVSTIEVTTLSGATVACTKGSTSIVGTQNGNIWSFPAADFGTYTITATLSGSTATQTVVVDSLQLYQITLYPANSILNNNSWATIKAVSDTGTAANYWSVGDRKAVSLSGTVGNLTISGTYYTFILGFNHNSSLEGDNRIHFQFGKTSLTGGTDICFIDSGYDSRASSGFIIKSSTTDTSGWENTYMRSNICGTSKTSYTGTFIGVLPSDLRANIKSVVKYSTNTGTSSVNNVTATTDYIFLLSEYEATGEISQSISYEAERQAQYSYYAAGNSKIKYKYNNTSTAADWWSRSRTSAKWVLFNATPLSSATALAAANYSKGFAPCFCI